MKIKHSLLALAEKIERFIWVLRQRKFRPEFIASMMLNDRDFKQAEGFAIRLITQGGYALEKRNARKQPKAHLVSMFHAFVDDLEIECRESGLYFIGRLIQDKLWTVHQRDFSVWFILRQLNAGRTADEAEAAGQLVLADENNSLRRFRDICDAYCNGGIQ